ncbi:MAG: hypothetical protein WCT04_18910 [Planctomycetota bacterium]
MKKVSIVLLVVCLILMANARAGQGGQNGGPGGQNAGPVVKAPDAYIQWYGTLAGGLEEAKRTGKPILFISAAPHCAGVSGMW